ncbi:MAG: glycosyltransferase family 9 protein [Deltaproteobacteria bacterium]|nr:glycosyltransferase family 9 protein [Deltaproteobacteria bacterium]
MKLLFIRRDNIGDLVCTTPAIRAVRETFPQVRIGVFVNHYNADALAGNPDVDVLHVYRKAKHVPGEGRLRMYLEKAAVFRQIRREKYDVAIGCGNPSVRVARIAFATGARRRIGYVAPGARSFYYNTPVPFDSEPAHEVERTFRLLAPLGIAGTPGKMVVVAGPGESTRFRAAREAFAPGRGKPLLAVSISARIPQNQWPEEKFVAFIEKTLEEGRLGVLLLWAPGGRDNPTYQGDDERAARIVARFSGRILAWPTPTVRSLIAAIAGTDMALTLDTGSLHIAAACGKPTAALMLRRKVGIWSPWGVPAELVAAEKGDVADLPVEAAFDAVYALARKTVLSPRAANGEADGAHDDKMTAT